MHPDFEFLFAFFTYSMRSIIALFGGVFLVLSSKKSQQNLPLGIIFFIIGLLYLRNGFMRFPVMEAVDTYNPLSYFVLIFIAPFTIFYAWFALGEKHRAKEYFLHFTPFLLAVILWSVLRLSGEEHIPFCHYIVDVFHYRGEYPMHVMFFLTLVFVFLIQIFSYFTIALRKFIKVWKGYKEHKLSLRPIKMLIAMDVLFLLYPLVGVVYMSFNNALNFGVGFNLFVVISITLLSALNISLKLPLKTDIDFVRNPKKQIKPKLPDNISLSEENDKDSCLVQQIKVLLEQNEFYRLPHLSLSDIATELNTNRSYVSASINKHFGCNFRQLLIRYRINATKELLLNSDMDIQAIIESVGFNTRGSFYQAFRENISEDLSPMEWRNIEREKVIARK